MNTNQITIVVLYQFSVIMVSTTDNIYEIKSNQTKIFNQ